MFGVWCEAAKEPCELLLWMWDRTVHLSVLSLHSFLISIAGRDLLSMHQNANLESLVYC